MLPDKTQLKSADYAVRCAASIRATIQLDAATYFPVSIEGEVSESGCDGQFVPVVHYGSTSRQPVASLFREGSTFRVEYELQKDRFDNPENSFWISTTQHYVQPWYRDSTMIYYWGREFRVAPVKGARLVKDVKTTAQEFGAGSQLRFDK